MKKILLPVDFSGHTDITCRYAIEFAKATGADIRLFHTYFDQILVADTSFPDTLDMSTIYNEELMKEIYKGALNNMDELEEKLNAQLTREGIGNTTISTVVTGGELEHELRSVCSDFHPDLVVMGTRGKGMNANTWGKVSSFIIDHARVPVLTIPEIRHFGGFGPVMFTADLSDGNARAIEALLELYAPFETLLHIVHFITKAKQTDEYLRMRTLQMKFGKEEKTGRIRFDVIEEKDEIQTIVNRFVTRNDIRMIAFQPHRHNMLYMMFTKNITRKNLFATNIPLVALPATL